MKDIQKEKARAVDLLIERGIAKDRHEAEALIIGGKIFYNNEPVKNTGQLLLKVSEIEIRGTREFVSRGALKLKKAVENFKISLHGKTIIDIGSSTGGFTDYLLQNGAVSAIAVDVNYGQFDWKLRKNPNIFLFERTNIKDLKRSELPIIPDLAAVDLSFISIRNVFGNIFDLLSDTGEFLLLVKPQFEARKELVGKKGIISDRKVHLDILNELILYIMDNYSVELKGVTFSPIKGAKGNIEFWVYAKKNINDNYKKNKINYGRIFETVENIIDDAHSELT
ncbi:MAG TPA: TlyA family RNA methyltransferase [Actinobacteria bacterium]|nr:TlyA family RNA methyltransferase [Actinomycetota bacterium]